MMETAAMSVLERNGHATAPDARLAQLERRVAQVAETSEQRTLVLRDAIAEFVATELEARDAEVAALKRHIGDLEHKLTQRSTIEQHVHEAGMRLEERAIRRDEAKRGRPGRQGERGARGERGPAGPRGPAGKPAKPGPTLTAWKIEPANFSVRPFLSDGQLGPELNLRSLFERYHVEAGGGS
jgi:hypothetical protein